MRLVVRALTVLDYLSENSDGRTLQDISDGLDIPVATAHRLLAVLHEQEFVVRNSVDRHYKLGPAAFRLATGIRRAANVAREHMERLTEATGETVFLSELIDSRVVCVGLVDGARPLHLFVRIGKEMPVHAAASARALMAFQPAKRIDELLLNHELVRYRQGTQTTPEAVKSRLALIRQRGYDVCKDELDPNIVAVGAPVRTAGGQVVASVTIAAQHDRMDPVTLRREILLVRKTAAAVSAGMGYRCPSPHQDALSRGVAG